MLFHSENSRRRVDDIRRGLSGCTPSTPRVEAWHAQQPKIVHQLAATNHRITKHLLFSFRL